MASFGRKLEPSGIADMGLQCCMVTGWHAAISDARAVVFAGVTYGAAVTDV